MVYRQVSFCEGFNLLELVWDRLTGRVSADDERCTPPPTVFKVEKPKLGYILKPGQSVSVTQQTADGYKNVAFVSSTQSIEIPRPRQVVLALPKDVKYSLHLHLVKETE